MAKNIEMQVLSGSSYEAIYPVPANHKNSHKTGGTDAISPSDIGAQSEIPITNTPDTNVKIWIDPNEDDQTESFYTKSDIDTLLQKKAPAGYGYGEKIICYNFTANFSEFTSKLDVVLASMTDEEAKQILIYDGSLSYTQTACTARLLCNGGGNEAVLTTDFDARGQAIVYRKKNGIWQPPEYVNPPMELGKEYRTTERYLGEPVYVKVVDFGSLPNTSSKSITLDNGVNIISVYGIVNGSDIIPTRAWGGTLGDEVAVFGWGYTIGVCTNINMPNKTAYMIVKYIKS